MTPATDDAASVEAVAAERKHTPGRRAKELIAYAIVAFAIAIVAFGAGRWWLEASKWDPLGDYPVQVVSEVTQDEVTQRETEAPNLPVFYLDQIIHSEAVKCVKPGEGVVTVSGTLSWVSDEPEGKVIETARGGGERGPSCVSYVFENRIPFPVLEEIEQLVAEGYDRSTWHLTGIETPVKPDGTEGVPRTWITTSFVLIHEDTP